MVSCIAKLNSFYKSAFIYTAGSVLTKTLGIFLIPLYTRYLSVREYGMLSLLNTILQLLSFVMLMGISSAAMRFYFDVDARLQRKKIYGNGLILIILLSISLLFFLVPVLYFLSNKFLPTVPFYPFIFITALVALFTPVIRLMLGLLRVEKREMAFVVFQVGFFLLKTISIIIAVSVFLKGLEGQLYAQLIVHCVFTVIALGVLFKYVTLSFSWSLSKKMMHFGFNLMPYFIITWIGTASPRFFLEYYLSLDAVGLFALASQFSGVMLLISTAVDNTLLPHFYETATKSNSDEYLGAFSTKYIAVFSAILLVILLLSGPALRYLTTPKYYEAIKYIPLLLLAGWFTAISRIPHWALMYSKKTSSISLISVSSTMFMLFLLIVFLDHLHVGLYGVSLAIVLSRLSLLIISLIFSRKYFPISFEYNKIAKIIAILLGSILILTFAQDSIRYSITMDLLLRIVLIAVSCIFLFKISEFRIIEIIRGGISPRHASVLPQREMDKRFLV